MIIDDGHLRLRDREPGIHFSVDIFFQALASSHGSRAIGIVLSGTGSDGMKGIEAIKAAGGITFAQDESAQQSGMPKSAIRTGCVDFVLSPRAMAHEISKLASIADFAFSSDPVEPAERADGRGHGLVGSAHTTLYTTCAGAVQYPVHRCGSLDRGHPS